MKAAPPVPLRLLFLLPFPPDLEGDHGGARATAAIIETLSAKHDVSVLYFDPSDFMGFRRRPNARELIAVPAPMPNASKSLWARTLSLLVRGQPDWVRETWSPEMAERAAQLATERKPDIVHFEFHVMGQYLPWIERTTPNAALIITEHEPGIVAAAEHGRGRNSIRQRLSSLARQRAWTRFERKTLSRAHAVITFTPKDRDAIRQLLGSSPVKVECIPLRFPLSSNRDTGRSSVESDLLFIGNFAHPPNVDAAKRLVERIFPRVRQAISSASLRLVGAYPPPELLAGAGVAFAGRVPDVAPYLRGASIIIAPLREGGGMRVKILEACAAGKAIIASAKAVEGLSLRSGMEFLAAETDDEFTAAAIDLLRNRKARERLGRAARAWAEQTQDPETWLAEYDQLYSGLLLSHANHEA